MALTGIEIFKLLPKTNCGKCGVPTCLAFAMSLAAGKAELAACPFISEDARHKLEGASAPPIRPVIIGVGERKIKVGGETVMFRHEKRFENPPGIAILLSDTMTDEEIDARLDRFKTLRYERVGLTLRAELAAARCDSGNAEKFKSLIVKVKDKTDANLILMSKNPDILKAGVTVCRDRNPLLYAITSENIDTLLPFVKESGCPVAVKADDLETISSLTSNLMQAGIKDIIIDPGTRHLSRALEDEIIIRRQALIKKFRPLGFPTIVFPGEIAEDPMKEALAAGAFIAKYAGVIVLSDFRGESLFPLLVLRMNLYTDPQRPLATAEGIYEIGGPSADSPVLLTCNFSLTYFIISGEIENSRVPSYLLVRDTEGLSVMTAWAAGKLGADTIAPFIKKCGIADKIKHRKLIIPGYISMESGGLEDELAGWDIQVGPREGAHIPAYLKNWGLKPVR